MKYEGEEYIANVQSISELRKIFGKKGNTKSKTAPSAYLCRGRDGVWEGGGDGGFSPISRFSE